MDITKLNHIHFTGIKGVGLTALALCTQDLGIKVTGSDVEEVFVTDETLKRRGIEWKIGFGVQNLDPKPDLVLTTGAHGGLNNPEVVAAREMGIPIMTHEEALAAMTQGREVIAVCGVGGKSTTSAMIATIFDVAGLHPSFAIGVGDIPSLGAPGRYDKEGKVFIVEADEYAVSPGVDNSPKFLHFDPRVIAVTNIEHDHPDVYPSIVETKEAFRSFFAKLPGDGMLIINENDVNTMDIIRDLNVTTQKYDKGNFDLSVPGEFNQLNASAAAAVARFYAIDEDKIKEGLKKFTGTRRRFEKMSDFNGATFYDDYAHMPNEIRATLKAAHELDPDKRIVAIFQPHTYSRTKLLLNEFAESFGDAGLVGIMDIYASARETEDLGMSGKLLADKAGVDYIGDIDATVDWIKNNVKEGDVVITMGAGDVFRIYDKLKQ